ncbi:MAG: hypothetical protein VX893_11085 [Candidatus Latescibacterota bacterium]|nr:hypothetical protein [Candidatus Latescibacterota bacterium]
MMATAALQIEKRRALKADYYNSITRPVRKRHTELCLEHGQNDDRLALAWVLARMIAIFATLDFSGETKGISDAIMANHNIGELRS